jgi:hypothetical protein
LWYYTFLIMLILTQPVNFSFGRKPEHHTASTTWNK